MARVAPLNAAVLLAEGRALHARGRVQDAFAAYRRALSADPGNAEAEHLLGQAYVALGQVEIGLAFLRRAAGARPHAAEYRVSIARTLSAQGRHDEAERELAAAAALDPGDADTHEALAGLQYRRGAVAEAAQSARRALDLAPGRIERLNIGHVARVDPAPRRPQPGLLRAGADLGEAALEAAWAERELIVWDDFLDDPLAVRAHAMALCSGASVRGNFPGRQSLAQDCSATMQRIADALGRPVRWDSPDHGAFRISLAADDAQADVHVDNPTRPDIFGGVLCLTLPEHGLGGTTFYRHRGSGWARRPGVGELRARGYSSFLEFQQRHLPPNRQQPFAAWRAQRDWLWEPVFEVPLRFNRLVVFRSDFFHAISELFGDTAENGRLVQLFHFEAPAGSA